ncbi:MAG: hypothetical protein ACTHOU_00770, partial [Aureliella sp.]
FTEVINYITAVQNYGQSIIIKKEQLQALERSVEVATDLFQTARGEYIDVLLAQRDMMEARTVIVETKQRQLTSIVNAYQALGGGGAPIRPDSPFAPGAGDADAENGVDIMELEPPTEAADGAEAVPQPKPDDAANK